MTVRRRLLPPVAFLGAVLAMAAAPHGVAACDSGQCVPQLASVTPLQITLDGKPLHVTLQGSNLSDVSSVLLSPVLPVQGFTVYNDSTVLVTLPANTPPGVYAVRVAAPEGGSDPTMEPQFQVFPTPPPTDPPSAPTPRPRPTPTPPVPQTGAVAVKPPPLPPAKPPTAVIEPGVPGGTSPTSAPLDIMIGLAMGATMYILWGHPRRLAGGWRSAPVLHLVGRPAQALHLGKVCLYCGRLHFLWNTRRDLWKVGRYCGPRCFISAEAMPSPLADEAEPTAAPARRAPWWRLGAGAR